MGALVRTAQRRAAGTVRRMMGSQDRLEQRPDPAEPMVRRVSTELATGDLHPAYEPAEP